MSNFKKYYRDENDFIEDYCISVDCGACNGTDQNGEPNGYGCPAKEEFIDNNYEKYMLEDDDIIELLEKENEKLEKLILGAYNIDAKHIDDPKVTYRDYYNDMIELLAPTVEKITKGSSSFDERGES